MKQGHESGRLPVRVVTVFLLLVVFLSVSARLNALVSGYSSPSQSAPPDDVSSPINVSALIMTEDFEGTFPTGDWDVLGDPSWASDECRPYTGSYSAWCASGGSAGLDPCTPSDYPNDLQAWMIYGPFDLSAAEKAEVTFDYWLESELDNDWLFWGASTDGVDYYGEKTSTDTAGWQSYIFDLSDVSDLGDLTGQSDIRISFLFTSTESVTYQGAFVDNIAISVTLASVTPTPTLTLTPTSTATITPTSTLTPTETSIATTSETPTASPTASSTPSTTMTAESTSTVQPTSTSADVTIYLPVILRRSTPPAAPTPTLTVASPVIPHRWRRPQ